MATDVVSSIGTAGTYTTLQAWEDACPADLVASDQRWIGELKNQEFTSGSTVLTIAGQTTDSTRYVYLRCETGASFRDNASVRSNALYYNASNGAGVRCTGGYANGIVFNTSYTRLEGLQVKASAGASRAFVINSSSPSCRVDSCIAESNCTTGSGASLDIFLGGDTKVINCLVVQLGSGYGIRLGANGSAFGCTSVRPGGGGTAAYTSAYGGGDVKNCAGFGHTDFASLTGGGSPAWGGGSGYNATDAASAAGSNNQTSLTFANQFESSTNDFRAASGGDMHAGTPDSTNTPVDITGLTRSATTPWIGCWEVAAAGGSPPIGSFCVNTNRLIRGV